MANPVMLIKRANANKYFFMMLALFKEIVYLLFLGVVAAGVVVLFSLNRLSGVPSFFKWVGGGVLFSLKRLSGVPSFFKWVVVAAVVVVAGFLVVAAGVVWAKPDPMKRSNKLAISTIFFICVGVFLVKK